MSSTLEFTPGASVKGDAPDLGGSGTYTGYAVQTGGTPVGYPN